MKLTALMLIAAGLLVPDDLLPIIDARELEAEPIMDPAPKICILLSHPNRTERG